LVLKTTAYILAAALVIFGAAWPADAQATDWEKVPLYWYYQNVSTNVPPLQDIVEMRIVEGERQFKWKVPNPPTKAALEALNAAAVAWYPGWCKDCAADYGLWEDKPKAAIKLTVLELNKLRAWVRDFKAAVAAATSLADLKANVAALPDMDTYSKAQVEAALKAEM
jgi:hypothetical protein